MTKMYIDHTIVEKALEFLDAEFGWSSGEAPRIDALRAALHQQMEPVEPVAWMYKGEPWFDGDSWHETYETTMDKTLAYFKDKNARALCFVEK